MTSSPAKTTNPISRAQHKSSRKGERGVTIFIVAAGMVSLLAMAVLAIDVVTLYVASGQAQQAADAAALAGAAAFSSSGFTSAPSIVPQSSVCNGSTGDADMRAQAIAAKFKIGGTAPSSVVTGCNFTEVENPQLTVTVTRTGLPSFFARIWGYSGSTVTATAKAEAYNPSFNLGSSPSPTIDVTGVKPWVVFNCNKSPCPSTQFIASNYAIFDPTLIGQALTLRLIASSTDPSSPPPPPNIAFFYAIDPPAPVSCPSSSAVSCNQIGTGPPGLYYHDNIACKGSAHFTCGQIIGPGQPIQVDTRSIGNLQSRTDFGTQCLIHANALGLAQGQDTFTAGPPPVIIGGGSNNPNSSMRLASSISRSDSVITVPVFNCPAVGACDGTAQLPIVGFLQLGIQSVPVPGDISVVVLNVAGCDPSNLGVPISGAGISPVPVRLTR
jgi:hypothetical protein